MEKLKINDKTGTISFHLIIFFIIGLIGFQNTIYCEPYIVVAPSYGELDEEGEGDQSVVIHEIMYDPPSSLGEDNDYEWIELFNTTECKIDLTGWFLNNVELQGTIMPFDYFLIARQDISDPDMDGLFFSAFYNSGNDQNYRCPVFDAEGQDLGMDNNGAMISLFDCEHEIVNSMNYDSYTGASGTGSTLERVVPLEIQGPLNWKPSKPRTQFGTPGRQNSTGLLQIEIAIEPKIIKPGQFLDLKIVVKNQYSVGNWFESIILLIDPDQVYSKPVFEFEDYFGPNESKLYKQKLQIPESAQQGKYLVKHIVGNQDIALISESEEFTVSMATDHSSGN